MASSPITSWQTEGKKVEAETDFIFLGSKITAVTIAMKLKDTCFLEESFDKPRQHIKKQRHHFADIDPYSQSSNLSSSHRLMWELDRKEAWAQKNWCFRIVVLEKTLESPLDSKDIKPVNPKGNQPWIVIGRTNAETEAPILWPPDVKSRLIGKVLDAGKDWGKRRREWQRNEMVG